MVGRLADHRVEGGQPGEAGGGRRRPVPLPGGPGDPAVGVELPPPAVGRPGSVEFRPRLPGAVLALRRGAVAQDPVGLGVVAGVRERGGGEAGVPRPGVHPARGPAGRHGTVRPQQGAHGQQGPLGRRAPGRRAARHPTGGQPGTALGDLQPGRRILRGHHDRRRPPGGEVPPPAGQQPQYVAPLDVPCAPGEGGWDALGGGGVGQEPDGGGDEHRQRSVAALGIAVALVSEGPDEEGSPLVLGRPACRAPRDAHREGDARESRRDGRPADERGSRHRHSFCRASVRAPPGAPIVGLRCGARHDMPAARVTRNDGRTDGRNDRAMTDGATDGATNGATGRRPWQGRTRPWHTAGGPRSRSRWRCSRMPVGGGPCRLVGPEPAAASAVARRTHVARRPGRASLRRTGG